MIHKLFALQGSPGVIYGYIRRYKFNFLYCFVFSLSSNRYEHQTNSRFYRAYRYNLCGVHEGQRVKKKTSIVSGIKVCGHQVFLELASFNGASINETTRKHGKPEQNFLLNPSKHLLWRSLSENSQSYAPKFSCALWIEVNNSLREPCTLWRVRGIVAHAPHS